MKTYSLYVALALFCLACNRNKENELSANELTFETPRMACNMIVSEAALNAPPPLTEMVRFTPPIIKDDAIESTTKSDQSKIKKIIKDGRISINVENVEIAKKYIDSILKKFNAYYESEEFANREKMTSYDLKIRVPNKHFESFLGAAQNTEGEITYKTINARDVTEEYYDNEIRLKSKKMFRDHYDELLKKAGKVDDILSIEDNLRVLQEEIESQEGHLKFLNDQVLYSTLNVHLFHFSEVKETKPEDTFGRRIRNSLDNGWDSVIRFVLWIITQWPWLIPAILLYILAKRIIKRRKKVIA